ncbi:MAG: NAD(P)H-dependent flavin oxidoreductase [Pseudodonghicola sp.]
MFQTPLTKLFGMKYPILVGGMMWLSTSDFVAACARGGAMAFLTPRSHATPEAFEADLMRCLDRAEGAPFGVNFSISRFRSNDVNDRCLEIALRHGITRYETAGNSPAALVDRIHDGGGVVIHKVTNLRHAIKAAACGVDAIAVVGMEAGGHPGMNPHPGHVVLSEVLREIEIPVALGGAIGTGGQVLAALAQGASAALLGSRFLTCDELRVHPNYKARMVKAGLDDTVAILQSIKDTWRVLNNTTARQIIETEKRLGEAAAFSDFGDLLRGDYSHRHAHIGGDVEIGLMSMSAAVAHASGIASARDVVDQLVSEMEMAWRRLSSYR